MSREVIDLTTATPEKKKPRHEEVVVVDDEEVQVLGVRQPPVPVVPVAAPPVRIPKQVCPFGVRCRKTKEREHMLAFAHHDIRASAAPPLPTLRLPPNLFGSAAGHAEYLALRQRQLEQEERALVTAVADSLRAEAEARERQSVREQQDAEYERGLQHDKRAAATVRQRSAETVVVEEEVELEKHKEEEQAAPAKRARVELLPEPSEEAGDAVTVTFQLPDGNRATRRFRGSDSCEQLFVFAEDRSGAQLELVQLPQTSLQRDRRVGDYGVKRFALFARVKEQ